MTLACHLDNLEMVHLLDLYGADINKGSGKFKNTPLMTATGRWNVRIVDYLIERGVNPFEKDSFGFTAARKAEIKNLRTITGMIKQYETKYVHKNLPPIFSKDKKWIELFQKINFKKYNQVEIWNKENKNVAAFKPSESCKLPGEYPFSSLEDNQDIFCLFSSISGNNVYNDSDDRLIY